MFKITGTIGILCCIVLGFASCKKNYTCVCHATEDLSSYDISTHYTAKKKESAETSCNNFEDSLKDDYAGIKCQLFNGD